MRTVFLYTIGLVMLIASDAGAQRKKPQPSRGGAPQIIEATMQRTLYGRHESEPRLEYRFVIIWKSKTPPSTFYWRPDANTWRDVTIAVPEQRPGLGPGDFMIVEKHVNYKDIRNGDKIIVTPHSHSDMEEDMPAAVKKMPVSSLYYKMGSQWMYVPIKPVKRPDLILQ